MHDICGVETTPITDKKKGLYMKFYDIDSVFTFGKYEGMTIAEVYEKDPKYLKYCEENIDEFYVSPSVMRELKSMNRAINDSALLDVLVAEFPVGSWRVIILVRDDGGLGQGEDLEGVRRGVMRWSHW